MKKVCLAVLPALTIVLELLPLGAVCIFATSPTERVKETFSYFSLTPFGYANFAPLITATLTVAIFLLSLFSLKKKGVLKALFVLSIKRIAVPKALCVLWEHPRPSPKSGKVCRFKPRPRRVSETCGTLRG